MELDLRLWGGEETIMILIIPPGIECSISYYAKENGVNNKVVSLRGTPIALDRSKLLSKYQTPSALLLRSFFLAGFRYKGLQPT